MGTHFEASAVIALVMLGKFLEARASSTRPQYPAAHERPADSPVRRG
jgi:hypothetical protein